MKRVSVIILIGLTSSTEYHCHHNMVHLNLEGLSLGT